MEAIHGKLFNKTCVEMHGSDWLSFKGRVERYGVICGDRYHEYQGANLCLRGQNKPGGTEVSVCRRNIAVQRVYMSKVQLWMQRVYISENGILT